MIGPTVGEVPEGEAAEAVTADEAAVGVTVYMDVDPYIAEVLDSSGMDVPNRDLYLTTSLCTYTAPALYDDDDSVSCTILELDR